MINADAIHRLKEQTDTLGVFEYYGLKPIKKGKGHFVVCPFHEDDKPSLSITPAKRLWRCFGCGESGDVFSFVQKKEQITFLEAIQKVASLSRFDVKELDVKSEVLHAKSPFTDKEILSKVISFYGKTFETDPKGKAYLAKRGITNEGILKAHSVGYVNGSLLNVIPKEESVYQQLIRLGILLDTQGTASPKERFANCVVFPLTDKTGVPVSVYGRHTGMETGGHFYIPGPKQGLFNYKNLVTQKPAELIITESVIDALSFMNQGIDNVVGLYGVNGFTPEHESLVAELQAEKVVLALDGDVPGSAAATQLREKLLLNFSVNCWVVDWPGEDANSYFQTHRKEEFELLIQTEAVKTKKVGEPEAKKQVPEAVVKPVISQCLTLKRVEHKGTRLAVTVKAENPATGKIILDTFNVYSEKDRERLREKCVEVLGLSTKEAEAQVFSLIKQAESQSKSGVTTSGETTLEVPQPEAISEADHSEALIYLKSPDLMTRIVEDYSVLGYIGEEMNKKLAYLVMTSRKMQNPLSLVIMSNSAAGKSSLQQATLKFCPKTEGKHFTRLTQQSLYYLGEDSLKHKFLSIEEEEGSQDANYSLKALLSAKTLTIASTTQDPVTGKKRADEYKTEGPLALMISTTSAEIEPEFESRTLVISVDESESHTQKIQEQQKYHRTTEGRLVQVKRERVIQKHQNAQNLLKAGLVVVNNYAPQLGFPSNRVRFRRAHDHYLDLIDCVAFLRQHQKEAHLHTELKDYIEVDKEDIRITNEIFAEVMGISLDELKPATREVLCTIVKLCDANKRKVFQRKDLREQGKYSVGHLHRHLKVLEELEYILPVTGSNGSKYTYELVYEMGTEEHTKRLFFLKDPSELKEFLA